MARLILAILPWCTLVSIVGSTPAAAHESARLLFDLDAGHLEFWIGQKHHQVDLGSEDLRIQWDAFRRLVAVSSEDDDILLEARRLGAALLSGAPQLSAVSQWSVSPLWLAPLSALIPPWTDRWQPLLTTTAITYEHLEILDREPGAGAVGDGVLAIIPYPTGVDPAVDDPEILLDPMRSRVRRLDTIPRNDTTLETVGANLAEQQYGIVLLRSGVPEAQTLLPVLAGGPPVLWWIRTENVGVDFIDDTGLQTEGIELAVRWGATGRSLMMDLWPRDQASVVAGAGAFIDAIQNGATAAEALRTARLYLYEAKSGGPSAWAGWVYLGDPQAPVELRKPGWFQRLFRPR